MGCYAAHRKIRNEPRGCGGFPAVWCSRSVPRCSCGEVIAEGQWFSRDCPIWRKCLSDSASGGGGIPRWTGISGHHPVHLCCQRPSVRASEYPCAATLNWTMVSQCALLNMPAESTTTFDPERAGSASSGWVSTGAFATGTVAEPSPQGSHELAMSHQVYGTRRTWPRDSST